MNRRLPLLLVALSLSLAAAEARADDQTRNVQGQLKSEGFYYGEVDGKSSAELAAAIRRYQIRNGLAVSGDLNAETLRALGVGGAPPATAVAKASPPPGPPVNTPAVRPAPSVRPADPEPPPRPSVDLRRPTGGDGTVGPARRPFVDEDSEPPPVRTPGVVPPPAPLDERSPVVPGGAVYGAGPYGQAFAGTPYVTAPRVVQEGAIRRAQQVLTQRGFYREEIDGRPGPATEEALLAYQRTARLPLTGRLDLQTLSSLRLLPGNGGGSPPLKPFNAPVGNGPRQVYRGVWVE